MHTEANNSAIAVIGMGCWYPGASNLQQLWENILARRCQFRQLPEQRLPLSDYYDPDVTVPDKTYGNRAAVIDGFEFDWVGKRVPKTAFESTDIVHWLALDVALKALEDAGYVRDSVPTERSGVILGNTLTGENTRSNTMRLRWPYVSRAIHAAAQAKGIAPQLMTELVETVEEYYKSVFPPITEDTLAGGLSNTIAGRICNYLNFDGGGYTVDGACASSLIAVATAATALARGDLDLALAGGVDVSLDPFELIGFAKTGALTSLDMNVYDRRASGFIPGEGCGFAVLKRLEDARAAGDYVYAVLRGWGISSDGRGSITAPNREGQSKALLRAYAGSGYSPHDLAFVEGHGTGTAVGDRTELEAIALAVTSDGEVAPRTCGVTSFKSLVGHTKAAAGIGGFIKTVMAVNRRVLPPTANCSEPNEVFEKSASCLYPIVQGEIRSQTEVLRAGVSGMGFGGINCHATLESGDAPSPHLEPSMAERSLLVSNQQTELFVLGAASVPKLLQRIQAAIRIAAGMSVGELVDLAAQFSRELDNQPRVRAAVIAGKPEELLQNLRQLEKLLGETPLAQGEAIASPQKDIWIANAVCQNRVGFLFPGQGSQQLNMARVLVERYPWAREFVEKADGWLREVESEAISQFIFRPVDTVTAKQIGEWSMTLAQSAVAQPAICLASLLWTRQLERLGVKPVAVGGHSLGELTAFHVAGAFDEKALLNLATVRGQAMSASGNAAGTMASLACSLQTAEKLLQRVRGYVVVANINSPRQVVISGDRKSVEEAIKLAAAQGIQTRQLSVSNAFHSQIVASASQHLHSYAPIPDRLENTAVPLFSSINGLQIMPGLNLREHFASQVLAQVDFVSLVKTLAQTCDLLIEVGPGRALSGLANDIIGASGPLCLPIASKPGMDRDLNTVLASLFVYGSDINWEALYEGRLVRPFVSAADRVFIENSCEKPFNVPTAGTTIAHPVAEDWFESMLTKATNLSPSVMSDYLSQRGKFIAQVIKADLENLPQATSSNSAAKLELDAALKNKASLLQPPVVTPAPKTASIPDLLLKLVEQRTGFPQNTLSMNLRLLDDLNLDSIKAAEFVAEVAKQVGVQGQLDPSKFTNATLVEIANALLSQLESTLDPVNGANTAAETKILPRQGLKSWVRNFIVEYVPQVAPAIPLEESEENWKTANALIVCEPNENGMAEALCDELKSRGARVQTISFAQLHSLSFVNREFSHCIAILPQGASSTQHSLPAMIGRLHAASTLPLASAINQPTVAYVQFGEGYFGTQPPLVDIEQCGTQAFAASLHLERPDFKVRAIDFSPSVQPNLLAERVIDELSSPDKYLAVGYDSQLTRRVPQPRVQHPEASRNRAIAWSSADVVLVTGGAKGITAECAFAFAQSTGVRMALVGSSSSESAEITGTLNRFRAEKLICQYYQCDIANANAVVTLIQQVRQELGEITGVIHGAGLNQPRRIEQVSVDMAQAEIAPKVLGAMNLCQALAEKPPKLFIGFSSAIGVTGMAGNAWYGFANEALDLILRRFEAEHPETSVLSIAFSVWSEVGMGARMGSVQTLAKMGIDAIPSYEGVRRFLHLMKNDVGDRQVIVAARVSLDTWRPAPNSLPVASRFLEQCYVEPGVEVIARSHLSLEKDAYVQDHVYKGSYLFPTVFGLEAMAQAVAYATGEQNFSTLRIEDVRLERPIVVNPDQGVEIEIRAEVLERESKNFSRRVHAQISTEQTGFAMPHFWATFVLDIHSDAPREHIEVPATALDIQPQRDLYGWLLFQGKRFQRLQLLYTLDSQKCIFRTKTSFSSDEVNESLAQREAQTFLLGDPFLRDSLLQVVQPIVPQDICLPIHIDSIEIYPASGDASASRLGVAWVQSKTEKEYHTTVFTLNDDGQVVEKLNGYQLRILEHRAENPTAAALANPSQWDEELLCRELSSRTDAFEMTKPEISLVYLPDLHALSATERHQRELPVFQQTVGRLLNQGAELSQNIHISWLESGKPVVEELIEKGADISLSHDELVCLCVAGWGSQGCDIAPITQRSRQDWIALLSRSRELLMQQLLEAKDSVDLAGTRIWAAVEALRKATNSQDITLAINQQKGDGVLFCGIIANSQMYVLTFPLKLARGPERVIAFVVKPTQATQLSATTLSSNADHKSVNSVENADEKFLTWDNGYNSSIYCIDSVTEANKQVLVLRWPVSLKDTANKSGSVYFSNYFNWMGKVSQIAMWPVWQPLTQQLATGEWGLVTNYAQTRILGKAKPHDAIEVHCCIGNVSGSNSAIDIYYDWRKILSDGGRERIAWSEHRATWVQIQGSGGVSPHPFPDYLQTFIDRVSPPHSADYLPQPLPEPLANVELGRELYRVPVGPMNGPLLREQTFETALEDTDLIGNIYFANYYVLQGRVLDRFFYEHYPDYYRTKGEQGEFWSLRSRCNHLREARPFDQIYVTMSLRAMYEGGISLSFEYFRLTPTGDRQKLAIGEHDVAWLTHEEGKSSVSNSLPQAIREALLKAVKACG